MLLPENIVASYRNVWVACCNDCQAESVIVISETLDYAHEALFASGSRALCPVCQGDDVDFLMGGQFVCPDCNCENTQVVEPSRTEKSGDITLRIHKNDEMTCMYCDTVFDLGATLDVGVDPPTFVKKLYRKS
jgi:hypothetical protein